jgi:5-oxoprolinase (ATP-hydrolysing)
LQAVESWVRSQDGRLEGLQGCDTTIGAGEAIIIQTPTAGGYGVPPRAAARRGLI